MLPYTHHDTRRILLYCVCKLNSHIHIHWSILCIVLGGLRRRRRCSTTRLRNTAVKTFTPANACGKAANLFHARDSLSSHIYRSDERALAFTFWSARFWPGSAGSALTSVSSTGQALLQGSSSRWTQTGGNTRQQLQHFQVSNPSAFVMA